MDQPRRKPVETLIADAMAFCPGSSVDKVDALVEFRMSLSLIVE
jgi:hypothetical protein